MKKIKTLLFAIFLICNFNSFGQWTEISNIGERFIENFNFLDDKLGYALMNDNSGNATIMKTVDGGSNWNELNLPMQTGEIQDIHFYAEEEGVIVIRNLSNAEVPSMIFRTKNAGVSWEEISPDSTKKGVGVGNCQFLNHNIGYFATDKTLYTTIDGGEKWTSKEFNEYILSLDFLDANHGILGTWDGTFGYKGGMLTTSDGGTTWTNNLLDEYYTSIVEVRQISSNVAIAAPVHNWAAIQAGQFYKTTDSGANWIEIQIPMPANDYTLRQIDFTDEMNGVICVGNSTATKIYRTTDGGQTWVEEGLITSTYDSDLQITANSGYIGGKTGSFYKRSTSTSAKEVPVKLAIQLYPSPAYAGQTIKWSSIQNFTNLLIIDQKGATIHQQYLNQNHGILPPLNTGYYFVLLSNEKVLTTTKLIIK